MAVGQLAMCCLTESHTEMPVKRKAAISSGLNRQSLGLRDLFACASTLQVESKTVDRDRTAIMVESGVRIALHLEREATEWKWRERVVRVRDAFGAVGEPSVAEHETIAAGREVVAMVTVDAVHGKGDPEPVRRPSPERPSARDAEGERSLDFG